MQPTHSLLSRLVETQQKSVSELPILLHTALPELYDQVHLSSCSHSSACFWLLTILNNRVRFCQEMARRSPLADWQEHISLNMHRSLTVMIFPAFLRYNLHLLSRLSTDLLSIIWKAWLSSVVWNTAFPLHQIISGSPAPFFPGISGFIYKYFFKLCICMHSHSWALYMCSRSSGVLQRGESCFVRCH